jgi:hypothetical protein
MLYCPFEGFFSFIVYCIEFSELFDNISDATEGGVVVFFFTSMNR